MLFYLSRVVVKRLFYAWARSRPKRCFLAKKIAKVRRDFFKKIAAFLFLSPKKCGGKITRFDSKQICYNVAYIRVLGYVSRKNTTVIMVAHR